jgi:AcrR family transcriptional regulator
MPGEPVKRRYKSPTRRAAAHATRDRICQAAEDLFTRDGYAGTSIRAIAARAGVSEATLYLAFPNKAALLDATILRAIRHSGSEPLSEILELDPHDLLARLAAASAAVMRHAAPLIAIGESAAAIDADLRPFRDKAYARVRTAMRAIADRLAEAGLLREGLGGKAAGDALYAIANATTHRRLVEDCGLPPERYGQWLAATFEAIVCRQPDGAP